MTDRERKESIVKELLDLFEIVSAPIPLEMMLQTQRSQLWERVDLSDLSMGFFAPMNLSNLYGPRMSLARMITRMVLQTEWGKAHGLVQLLPDDEAQHAFARILVMPAHMIDALPPANQTIQILSDYFEVPPADVELRLSELQG